MTREDEILARLEAATPGEWFHFGGKNLNSVGRDGETDAIVHWVGFDHALVEGKAARKANARLIANAPADLRYLLDENKDLRRLLLSACDSLDLEGCLYDGELYDWWIANRKDASNAN